MLSGILLDYIQIFEVMWTFSAMMEFYTIWNLNRFESGHLRDTSYNLKKLQTNP